MKAALWNLIRFSISPSSVEMRIPRVLSGNRSQFIPAVCQLKRSFLQTLRQNTVKAMSAQYSSSSRQSPIAIESSKAVKDQGLVDRPLQFSPQESTFSITNTGSTIDAITPTKYLLSGGPLESPYSMLGFHFHWQNQHNLSAGSEHTLDGKAFASELHIVHMNTEKYDSFDKALNHGDGLSVLGVFLELTSEEKGHSGLETLCEALRQIEFRGSSTEIKAPFCPYSLLPADTRSYWAYPGSLTTPPFSECVTWIVFKDPIQISMKQLEQFRLLKTAKKEHATGAGQSDLPKICHNVRETFPLGDRILKASF